jgi:hypothetical protein
VREDLPLSILNDVDRLQIDGKVFMNMSDGEIKDEFSTLAFGHRKKLTLIRDEFVKLAKPWLAIDSLYPESDLGERNADVDLPTTSVQELYERLESFFSEIVSKTGSSYFPLLATTAIHTNHQSLKESFRFVSCIDWMVVFDFDAAQKLYHFLKREEQVCINVKTFEDFINMPSLMGKGAAGGARFLQQEADEDASHSDHISWSFCNGYKEAGEARMDIATWKSERSRDYRGAVRSIRDNTPANRAALLILVTSNDDVFIEASEELLFAFKERWLMIAESPSFATAWINGLRKRSVKVDMDRCLIGCSFAEINKVMMTLKGVETVQPDSCFIKSSSGADYKVPQRKKLFDLEIVSEQELRITAANVYTEQVNMEEEEKFYQGNRASWWNFHFPGHVCRRDMLGDLVKSTRDRLGGEDVDSNDSFATVTLYHQPGAGGTTLAMNVLWELQKDFKCCLVKKVSSYTAEQIVSLFELGESKHEDAEPELGESKSEEAKPVLVMVDNEDDKIYDLGSNIEDLCLAKDINKLVCVLLILKRRTIAKDNADDDDEAMFLQQKLSAQEKQFFINKYEELKQKGRGNVDSLLVLNIMKENFNTQLIKTTVEQYIEAIGDYHHRTVLKYTALLNCYDLSFRGIPVSCFDPLFPQQQGDVTRKKGSNKRGCWEENLTPGPLMVFTFNNRLASRHKCLRVSYMPLCQYILLCTEDQSHGDMMEGLLTSALFKGKYQDVNFRELVSIIKDVMKKRGMEPDGKRRCRLSPFVTKLTEEHEVEQAVTCMNIVYEKTADAFLAQQIARVYLFHESYDQAEEWASEAVERWPKNSFLWDTYGQVFKKRLNEIRFDSSNGATEITDEVIGRAVKYARDGFIKFQKVEELSKEENSDPPNTAGLFGQMETVWQLSTILNRLPCLSSKIELRQMMSGKKGFPQEFLQIPGVKQHEAWLSSLRETYCNCLEEAEEKKMEYADVKSFKVSNAPGRYFLSDDNIEKFRNRLTQAFGGPTLESAYSTASAPRPSVMTSRSNTNRPGRQNTGNAARPNTAAMRENPQEEGLVEMGGRSLYSVMDRCRKGDEGRHRAKSIFDLASFILGHSEVGNLPIYELKMALASALTLIGCHDGALEEEQYGNLLYWAADLCTNHASFGPTGATSSMQTPTCSS